MFHTIIVEDEKPILDLMKYLIGHNPCYTISGTFTNPLEALACLHELKPDVAFLDVEMPKMNGLELAQKINELSEHTRIIFTTAYKEYALEAFKVYAFDYILKPVTKAAIERVTDRLIKQKRPAAPEDIKVLPASIRCFGGFDIRNPAGEPVRFQTRKTEELFAYFLCHPGREINKWYLADLLWSDMEERALHNLHNTIYRLKKMLKENEMGMDIQKTNEGYMLETANRMYDVLAFQQFDFSTANVKQAPAQLEQLCVLYKGPLLANKEYLWKIPLEEGYGKKYAALVQELVLQDLAGDQWAKAEQHLDAYLSLYPLDEEMNQSLMDLYARSGNTEKIAKHYARFEVYYRREMGLEPPQEMKSRVDSYLKFRSLIE